MPTLDGAETLRERVYTWNRKGHLGNMARDCGVSLSDLDDWSAGRRQQLDVAALEKVAAFLDVKYDAATDTLQSLRPQTVMPPHRYGGPPESIPINMSESTLNSLPPRRPIKSRQ